MNRHLVLTDFDGTIANTFKDSPNGMSTHRAYELAVDEVFGKQGLQVYIDQGGLRNREPGELVRSLQATTGQFELSPNDATQKLIDVKLGYLLPEISPQWPEFYPGVKEFLQHASRDGYWVDVGILSSGHDEFIRRALEVNGIDFSNMVIVTSDLLRQREVPIRPRHKPHSYQFAEAHRQWLVSRGVLPLRHDGAESEPFTGRNYEKPNILYVGDDPIKDGGLAQESRVPFIFVPFTQPDFVPDADKGQMRITDFVELADVIGYQSGDSLAKGASFAKVLFDKSDRELFPPLAEGEIYERILRERSFR